MPLYNFVIECPECDGNGEYEISLDPNCPTKECYHCNDGYLEVEEHYDSESDLIQDYPDATSIYNLNGEK